MSDWGDDELEGVEAQPIDVDEPDGPTFGVDVRSLAGHLVDVELFVTAGTYVVRVEAVGEQGTATAGFGRSSSSFLEHFTAAYDLEVQAWVDAVAAGGVAGAGARDGYAAAAVCEAAIRSLFSGARETVSEL